MFPQMSAMQKKIAIIFLVLTGVLVVAICIAVPLGNSVAGGSQGCNSTTGINGTCEDVGPQPGETFNSGQIFGTHGAWVDREAGSNWR